MQDFPFGQLVALLLFVLLPLLSWLIERLRRRFEPPASPRRPAPQPAPRTYARPVSVDLSERRAEPLPPTESPERRPHRHAPARLFTSRRDLRRAIILMTVLGPCRATEPAEHERRRFPV